MEGNRSVRRKSMTTNGIFSFAAKVVAMIAPLVVYPYVMRVLGASSFGKVTYAESLVGYFSLMAVLGISSYAQRESAVMRDNPIEFRKIVSRAFALNLIMTFSALVVYLGVVFIVPGMRNERPLFLVFSLWIVGGGLSMEWLYTAQERFDLVSIREIVAKSLYILLCFTLVKTSDNYLIYGIIVVFTGTVFTMIWNISGIMKKQCGVKPNLKYSSGFSECLKPIFFLALLIIGSKLFTDFDVLMIKWFTTEQSDKAVGLYNSAIILPKAFDSILMTISAVITPQLFIATRQNDENKVVELMNKTSNALFFIAIPAIFTCLFLSTELICVFAGTEYVDAAPVLQIYSLVIMGVLVITLAGTRTYIARQKERKLFYVLIFGAALNIILNYFFIRTWGIKGAALATMTAYFVVLIVELTLEHTWHYVFTIDKLKYLVAGSLVSVVFIVIKQLFHAHPASILITGVVFAGIGYVFVLYLMGESTLLQVKNRIVKILERNK